MTNKETEVLVVGAGQAGVAMSEHLSGYGVPHLVLERRRIAERWRSQRWDSLVANGPAWHDRFPGMEFAGLEADEFATKEQVADYIVAYAEKIGAPIRSGVEERLLAGLSGGLAAGGEEGPVRSAGLAVVEGVAWRAAPSYGVPGDQ